MSDVSGRDRASVIVIGAVFCAAITGLLYELVAGALASYLLGDSVRQFSITIGLFLTSMGIGAWLTRFIESRMSDPGAEMGTTANGVGGPSR